MTCGEVAGPRCRGAEFNGGFCMWPEKTMECEEMNIFLRDATPGWLKLLRGRKYGDHGREPTPTLS